MGIVREPLDIDFEFDPRPLTDDEKQQIRNYIKNIWQNIQTSTLLNELLEQKSEKSCYIN